MNTTKKLRCLETLHENHATTNNNDTIFGIILLKIKHSNYKL